MAQDHRIRLHGPWQCQSTSTAAVPSPPTLTVKLPLQDTTAVAQWLVALPESSPCTDPLETGSLEFVRRFHWPHPVASGQSIHLEVAATGSWSAVLLNGEPLPLPHQGAPRVLSLPIQDRLQLQNEVRLVRQLTRADPLQSLVIDSVALWIAE